MSYGVSVSWQVSNFFMSMGLGFLIGLIYELILSSITTFNKSKIAYIFSDLTFSIISTIIFFCYTLVYCQGETHLISIIASVIGAVVFHFSAGKIISSIIKKLMGIIKVVLKLMFFPFLVSIRFINSKLKKILDKLNLIVKQTKIKQNFKQNNNKQPKKQNKSTKKRFIFKKRLQNK